MAKVKTLKDPITGAAIAPRTAAKAVTMEDGATVEATIADVESQIANVDNKIIYDYKNKVLYLGVSAPTT